MGMRYLILRVAKYVEIYLQISTFSAVFLSYSEALHPRDSGRFDALQGFKNIFLSAVVINQPIQCVHGLT
jgi:hypothetical protein